LLSNLSRFQSEYHITCPAEFLIADCGETFWDEYDHVPPIRRAAVLLHNKPMGSYL
jgi:hypothetical protein